MKKEYQIIGSNNFWYASCLTSMKEVKEQVEHVKKYHHTYADPETGHHPETPETLYVYLAEEIKRIEIGGGEE